MYAELCEQHLQSGSLGRGWNGKGGGRKTEREREGNEWRGGMTAVSRADGRARAGDIHAPLKQVLQNGIIRIREGGLCCAGFWKDCPGHKMAGVTDPSRKAGPGTVRKGKVSRELSAGGCLLRPSMVSFLESFQRSVPLTAAVFPRRGNGNDTLLSTTEQRQDNMLRLVEDWGSQGRDILKDKCCVIKASDLELEYCTV
ncbi:unnamed protein product [Leuciscus chuanchicus]